MVLSNQMENDDDGLAMTCTIRDLILRAVLTGPEINRDTRNREKPYNGSRVEPLSLI
jgi:hypothetical protein